MGQKQIESSDILPVLFGQKTLEDGEYECQGIDVLIIKDGVVTAIGCDGPSHNNSNELGRLFNQLNQKLGIEKSEPGNCEKCNGTGWLKSDTSQARMAVITMFSLGIFRGIRIEAK